VARRDDAGTGNRAQGALFLGPGLVYWLALFLVPVGLILVYSFFRRTSIGGIEYTFTLDNYVRATEPLFVKVFLFSIRTALITTAIALVLGYATAYFIATRPVRYRLPLLVLVVLPFWTNLLIRTYAWIALLNNEGLINKGLRGLGIIESPLPLLNNQFSIVVGLLYAFLPLMVLPLYASIERLGPRLREAGADLGGSPTSVFRRVTFPMTIPGVLAGCIFVFVPSLANFIVPDLLGGGLKSMIGNLIQQQFFQARDWPFGAALAMWVIAITMILLVFQALMLRREGRMSGRGA